MNRFDEDYQGPVFISEVSNRDCYSWKAVQLGKIEHEDSLWFREGSGCSCNSIEESKWEPLRESNWRNFTDSVMDSGDTATAKVEFLSLASSTLEQFKKNQQYLSKLQREGY